MSIFSSNYVGTKIYFYLTTGFSDPKLSLIASHISWGEKYKLYKVVEE